MWMSNFKIKNRVKDGALRGLIYLCTGLTVGSLLLILGYIFVKGVPGLSVDFFIRDFNDKTAYVTLQETDDLGAVSYTHLDVYKRQRSRRSAGF